MIKTDVVVKMLTSLKQQTEQLKSFQAFNLNEMPFYICCKQASNT
jgi:hypothetical protein